MIASEDQRTVKEMWDSGGKGMPTKCENSNANNGSGINRNRYWHLLLLASRCH